MPIHLSPELAEEFFREEEAEQARQAQQQLAPSVDAQMEAAQNYQAALNREAESQRDWFRGDIAAEYLPQCVCCLLMLIYGVRSGHFWSEST